MGEVRFSKTTAAATTHVPLGIGFRFYAVGLAGLLLVAGCGLPVPNGDSTDPTTGDVPVVRLTLSNPTPQVNEEVTLQCEIVTGGSPGVTFDFQPNDGRLFVDRSTGTATFIVEGSDIGVAFSFTCSATNNVGTSEPSNELLIVPT